MSELFKVYTANVSGVCEKPKYDPEVNNYFYKLIKLKFDSNFYDNDQVVIIRLAYNYQIPEALQRDNEIKNNFSWMLYNNDDEDIIENSLVKVLIFKGKIIAVGSLDEERWISVLDFYKRVQGIENVKKDIINSEIYTALNMLNKEMYNFHSLIPFISDNEIKSKLEDFCKFFECKEFWDYMDEYKEI